MSDKINDLIKKISTEKQTEIGNTLRDHNYSTNNAMQLAHEFRGVEQYKINNKNEHGIINHTNEWRVNLSENRNNQDNAEVNYKKTKNKK